MLLVTWRHEVISTCLPQQLAAHSLHTIYCDIRIQPAVLLGGDGLCLLALAGCAMASIHERHFLAMHGLLTQLRREALAEFAHHAGLSIGHLQGLQCLQIAPYVFHAAALR